MYNLTLRRDHVTIVEVEKQ